MTFKRAVSLRNALIFLCAAAVCLIGVKAVHISQKISWVKKAERAYEAKDLLEAERWYAKARDNGWIDYREREIADRLKQLAPITRMKQQVSELDRQAGKADSSGNLKQLIEVYGKLAELKSFYMKPGGPYASYYKQTLRIYDISNDITGYFQHFKQLDYAALKQNLDKRKYDDESFKERLLSIPDVFYGGADSKSKQLSAKFKTYDETRLARMAADGKFSQLLDASKDMLALYRQLDFEAPWIGEKAEEIGQTVLEKDIEQENYSLFAKHAVSYIAFADATGLRSTVKDYIESRARSLMRKASRLASAGKFEQAIELYESLQEYRSTIDEVASTRIKWMKAEPVQMLKAHADNLNYSNVISGTNRFGAKVFAAASDDDNGIHFARMTDEDHVNVVSNAAFPANNRISSIAIQEQLSTKKQPVLLVIGDSTSRHSYFALFQAADDSLTSLLQIDGDSLSVLPDGRLLIDNPDGEAAGQTAVYELTDGTYQYTGIYQEPNDTLPGDQPADGQSPNSGQTDQTYSDITVDTLPDHQGEKVRFACNIVSVMDDGRAVAEMGDSYVLLDGSFTFKEGAATVSGSFSEYADVQKGLQTLSLPSFNVEALE